VLFLDVDGVLNSETLSYSELFSSDCVVHLHRIFAAVPDLRIVFSTSWRLYSNRHELLRHWQAHSLPTHCILGDTPEIQHSQRGHEIQRWLDEAPHNYPDFKVRNYAVLDDEPQLLNGFHRHVTFICDPILGLTPLIADRVIAHFASPGS